MLDFISNRIRHFFHVVSNVRPIVWICLYVALMPIFALIYNWLPEGQFRIPDGGTTDYGSWLYYSIVTITTLGFGDYTPAMAGAQAVTAIEVGCGILILGFFLNAVGSMKSEIDVTAEVEKQRLLHVTQEHDKLVKSMPMLIHNINRFLAFCYAVTTPAAKRSADMPEYNRDFQFKDMADLYKPSGLDSDQTDAPAVEGLLKAAARTALCIDSLQNHVDLTLWPELLENCFTFVADFQMFTASDALAGKIERSIQAGKDLTPTAAEKRISEEISAYSDSLSTMTAGNMAPYVELFNYIKKDADLAVTIEKELTAATSQKPEDAQG